MDTNPLEATLPNHALSESTTETAPHGGVMPPWRHENLVSPSAFKKRS